VSAEQAAQVEQGAAAFSPPRAGWWTLDGVSVAAFDGHAHLRWWLHRIGAGEARTVAVALSDAEHAALREFRGIEDYGTWRAWLDRARDQLKKWETIVDTEQLAQRYCGPLPRTDAAALTFDDDLNSYEVGGVAETDLLARMRRLGWLSSEEPLPRLTGAEGSPRPAVEVLAVLVDTAERKVFGKITPGTATIGHRANRATKAVEKSLKRAPEPATYQGDGEVIAAVLRRHYGDESTELAMAVLEALRVLQRGTVKP
jgi:hypothetical protein